MKHRRSVHLFPRVAVSYAVLLVVLFGIAAVAVWHTIDFLGGYVTSEVKRGTVALIICSLTLGFMSIAGAFGLWAIQFSAAMEGRRRIGRFVDTMDYMADGILALDHKGRITGFNAAARQLAGDAICKLADVREALPCLSAEEVALMLTSEEPQEVEQRILRPESSNLVRFRSLPSEGVTLLLLSDITAINTHRLQNRQAARLQLIGQIARGVAHDFNNLLCAISGHASLLARLPSGTPAAALSARAIIDSVERGATVAGHLLELARPSVLQGSARTAQQSVQIAAEHLRDSLSSNWRIETSDQDVPPLSLTGIPLEQTILNLGLLVADSLAAPGILRIAAGVPGSGARFDVDHPCAGVILVSAAPSNGPAGHDNDALRETGVEPGAILSVVRSLVEEAGGTLHSLTDASGFPIYRVALPAGQPPAKHRESVTNAELAGYVRQWSVLLACEAGLRDWFKSAMTAVGMRITAVTDIASALAQIDENRAFDGIVLDEHLLAPEPAGVLRAIVRLQPASAIVLLSHRPPALLSELADNAVTVQPNRDINALMLGLIEGKSLAARRPRPASRTA